MSPSRPLVFLGETIHLKTRVPPFHPTGYSATQCLFSSSKNKMFWSPRIHVSSPRLCGLLAVGRPASRLPFPGFRGLMVKVK